MYMYMNSMDGGSCVEEVQMMAEKVLEGEMRVYTILWYVDI